MYIKPLNAQAYINKRGFPIINSSSKNSPTGLFSQAVFGYTEEEQIKKAAFINLHCYVLTGGILDIFQRIDRKLVACATTKNEFCLINGNLLSIEEVIPEDLNDPKTIRGYGPMFLYEIWDKIDKNKYIQDKGKYVNKEMKQTLLRFSKDECFMHYQLVLPLIYRLEDTETGNMVVDYNQYYADIILYSNLLAKQGNLINKRDIEIIVQNKVYEFFRLLSDRFLGPHGMARKTVLSRAVDRSSRMNILPVQYNSRKLGKSKIGVTTTGLPVNHLISSFGDYVLKYSKDFIEVLYDRGYLGDIPPDLLAYYDIDMLTDVMKKMDDTYFRLQPVPKIHEDGTTSPMIVEFEILNNQNRYETVEKPLTWIEFFYIVLVTYVDVTNTKVIDGTRYPVDSMLSLQFLRPVPLTLQQQYLRPTKFMGREYNDFPFIDETLQSKFTDKIFEQGNRNSSAVVVGWNGRKLPFYMVTCDRNFTQSWKVLKPLCWYLYQSVSRNKLKDDNITCNKRVS